MRELVFASKFFSNCKVHHISITIISLTTSSGHVLGIFRCGSSWYWVNIDHNFWIFFHLTQLSDEQFSHSVPKENEKGIDGFSSFLPLLAEVGKGVS